MLDSTVADFLDCHEIRDGRVLVAVSGGRDSMVLLDLLKRLGPARQLECVVGHVNHGLRGEASESDEAHVRRASEKSGLDFNVRHVNPGEARANCSSRDRPSPEEAARSLRREALLEMADETGCRFLATAHHAGDQAETVLLRLFRGTGPGGLAAMPEISRDGRWLKPLLKGMPEAVLAWATTRSIEWREDASNEDRSFSRNRLRHDVIPSLEATFNPQLLRSLVHLAEAQRRDLEWIEAQVEQAAEERIEVGPSGIRLAIDGWNQTPEALARRVVHRALSAAGLGREITRTHLERVLAFLCRGRAVGRDKVLELPEGIELRRQDSNFLLSGPAVALRAERVDESENATLLRQD